MAKSAAFVADLPDMTPDQLAKLYSWGKSSCAKFDVQQMENGAMLLVAVRKKPGSARDHMRLLRTNMMNWSVQMPAKQTGWLRLIIDEADSARSESAPLREESAEQNDLQPTPVGPTFTTRARFQLEEPKNLLTHPEEFAKFGAARVAQIAAH